MTENLRNTNTDTFEKKYWDWSVKVHQQREKDIRKLEGGESAHTFTIEEIQEHVASFGDMDKRHTRLSLDIAPLFNKNNYRKKAFPGNNRLRHFIESVIENIALLT